MKNSILFIFVVSVSVNAQINQSSPASKITVPSGVDQQKEKKSDTKAKPKKVPPKQLEAPKHKETILEKVTETTEKAVEDVKESAEDTKALRDKYKYFGYVIYSPFDLIIPSKMGASIGYNEKSDRTWEFEYLRGSVSIPWVVKDIGGMKDERISLIARSYFNKNSFNISYGLSYYNFSINLSEEILNRMTYGKYGSIDLLEVQSLGLNVGVGNRWTFAKNLSFGVDWVSLSQPIFTLSRKSDFLQYASNQKDREDVDKVLRWVGNFPRLTLLKLQLGFTF